jgi:NAD+ synthase (glutamine-hydrolysing)
MERIRRLLRLTNRSARCARGNSRRRARWKRKAWSAVCLRNVLFGRDRTSGLLRIRAIFKQPKQLLHQDLGFLLIALVDDLLRNLPPRSTRLDACINHLRRFKGPEGLRQASRHATQVGILWPSGRLCFEDREACRLRVAFPNAEVLIHANIPAKLGPRSPWLYTGYVKIALGQVNPTVGDFSGNAGKIIDFALRAQAAGAGLILFPELSVCGYPPRDLVERPSFLAHNRENAERIAAKTQGIAVICGLVTPAESDTGKSAMNSAALLIDGRVAFVQSKMLLPTYDVFDEMRNFAPARSQELFSFCGNRMALTICEDAWNDKQFWGKRLYALDPVDALIRAGGTFVLNISASPFWIGKRELRRDMLASIARQHKVPVVMVNQVGGNDSLVFDGSSLVLNAEGEIIAQGKSFEEDLILFDSKSLTGAIHEQIPGDEASVYSALVLGTRDYMHKCGFQKAIVGLSGGIDSALTAVIAADAVGPENVFGVGMPGPYSSEGSISDARVLARNLDIRFEVLPISQVFEAYRETLQYVFKGCAEDVTEENIQSRARGTLLMALSNKFGAIVLSTGNKSELGVGYCTLYGDMVGGLAVISDVPKTLVYRLSRYVNSRRAVIPEPTLDKPPSAELRPDQKDSDSLPPYEVLDAVLEDYVEDLKPPERIAAERGFDIEVVQRVICMVERAEYKRQQAAPGLKISPKAFGYGRRFPIAAKCDI